jgi:putative nucleotidyltransferase with HDIG domain
MTGVTPRVTSDVRRLVGLTVAAAIATIAAATLIFPLRPGVGDVQGIVYWTVAATIASAIPVRLPRGTIVSVAAGPILASMILGGPVAGAAVAFFGTIDRRELLGRVPWYGTLYNHAASAGAICVAGSAYEMALVLGPSEPAFHFLSALMASAVFFAVEWSLSTAAVAARTRVAMRTVWAQDVGGVAVNLIGLAPVAYLMALVFQLPNGVGWWATPLFVVPLFTTRLAYARYVETRELFEQTIEALAKAVDARDVYTRNHSSRVSHIAEAMCRVMRLPESEIEKIKWAGLLHDVGKIGIRDNILLKEGPLDREERLLMNQHPTIGAEIVAPASQLSDEAPLIKAHHEWFNGSGYPDGIEALEIPLGARILTIADAYEAMTSSRPYRKIPLTHEQAVDQLQRFSGIQFDPEIVPVLVNLDREILDRPPDRPDELPTMLHQPDPRTAPRPRPEVAASVPIEPEELASRKARHALASDDVS